MRAPSSQKKRWAFQKTGEDLLRAGVTFNFDRADLATEQGRRVPAVNRARDQQRQTNLIKCDCCLFPRAHAANVLARRRTSTTLRERKPIRCTARCASVAAALPWCGAGVDFELFLKIF
jgi:hypothetical protein